MHLAVLGNGINHVVIADGRHRMNFQPAHRCGVCRARLFIGFTHLVEDDLATLQIADPGLGQRQAPGGAVDQARLQSRLQAGDGLGHIGCGAIEDLGGCREAAALRNRHKKTHGLENVHRGASKREG
ncbi:hypothetical protein D3C73_698370 [compost metagenome]